jgi:hypothetical protein
MPDGIWPDLVAATEYANIAVLTSATAPLFADGWLAIEADTRCARYGLIRQPPSASSSWRDARSER